jgi:PP-loop superfamily ATP-utilizing enzyme
MRTVCWFSCGAASAVATKIALAERERESELIIAYTEVKEEHLDNKRFLADCEEWFGQKIEILGNDFYDRSIYRVFEKNYIRTPKGAPCTRALKKQIRERFEKPTDRQVFGYTAEEQARLDRFIDANADVNIWTPLIEKGLGKEDCLAMLKNAGIELPAMYKLGYHNNNCIGCVKGGMGYWNKIKVDFPEHFDRMAKLERFKKQTIFKDRYLDELKPTDGNYPQEPNIECSIFCQIAEQELQL